LVDTISTVATGRPIPRSTYVSEGEEQRKQITSIALSGDPIVLIDNIDKPFGGAAYDAALTSVSWRDRKLTTNEIVTVPLLTTFFGTGNNIVLRTDISRRVCHVRLSSPLENPEERQDFEHPDIIEH